MIHPDEFEWIINSTEQHKLAVAIAEGVVAWITKH
jgi:N-acetylmuramoyl-L-alanine amidase